MTEATPLSLCCDGITSRAIWPFPVDEWGFRHKLRLNLSPFLCVSPPLFFFSLCFCSFEQAEVAVLGVLYFKAAFPTALWQSSFCSWATGCVQIPLFTHWICCRLQLLRSIQRGGATEFLSHIALEFPFSFLPHGSWSLCVYRLYKF